MANEPDTQPVAPANNANSSAQSIDATQAKGSPAGLAGHVSAPPSPAYGRQAFSGITRTLTEGELANPGVQKLLLEMLEQVDARCAYLEPFGDRFHEADKEVGVLRAKLDVDRSTEVAFGVGVGIGGILLGYVPAVWVSEEIPFAGPVLLAVGALLVVGAIAFRVVRR